MGGIRYNVKGVLVDDEGVRLGVATEFNFVGANVTVTLANGIATVSVSGISGINTNNTVFIDPVYGNDATGLPERDDRPFLTYSAARTAALAYFVGGDAPSATNRILYEFATGLYAESIILDTFFDYNLGDSVLQVASGADAAIDDQNLSCNCIVYGNATIRRTTNANTSAIRTGGVATDLTVFCNVIDSTITGTAAVLCVSGKQTINVNTVILGTNTRVFQSSGGTGAIQIINVNDSSTLAAISCYCEEAIQIINCKKGIVSTDSVTVQCVTGEQTVNAGLISSALSGNGGCVTLDGGTQIINADNIVSASHGVTCNSGTQNVNVFALMSTGKRGIDCQSGTVVFNGNVTSSNASTGNSPLHNAGGTLTFTGNLIATSTSFSINVTAGTTNIYNSEMTASNNVVAMSGGTLRINNSRIKCTTINTAAVDKSGAASILIIKGVTIITTGTGASITASSAQNVLVYGGCDATVTPNVNITQQVNTMVIDTNVI